MIFVDQVEELEGSNFGCPNCYFRMIFGSDLYGDFKDNTDNRCYDFKFVNWRRSSILVLNYHCSGYFLGVILRLQRDCVETTFGILWHGMAVVNFEETK